ncbi:MAG: GDP-mannose 4,6-dehydratase [Planctomycetes bacterium]|nr:GDP-mannose 4,6-dehydratase [Planctomycetota bacterium]MBI3845813.1 GDP-mannose 4,6-dehydratase [Planctomycetota bacterium]
MMRVLVTGASGFVGRHAVDALDARGHEVVGTWREKPHPGLESDVVWVQLDVLDRERLASLILDLQPQAILHLAAAALPTGFDAEPWPGFEANVRGTLNVTMAATLGKRPPRVVVVSSGEAYGRIGKRPHRETDPLRPVSLYGASKASAEAVALGVRARHGVPIVIARPFNTTGPGQADTYVCSRLARECARLAREGRSRTIEMGNLDVRRDFLDVRDAARAFALLVERGKAGEAYNVCSGRTHGIREIATLLARELGFDTVPRLRSTPSLRRPLDLPTLAGSPAKIRRLGFRPRFALRQTLRDLADFWSVAETAGEGAA